MKTLALSLALGAAVLCGGSAANAAPAQNQAQAPVASHGDSATPATDMSSRHRGYHRWHRWHRHHRHWGYAPGYYRSSYGYYGAPAYYRPAPVVSFGFGFGGPRWGHHHHHW